MNIPVDLNSNFVHMNGFISAEFPLEVFHMNCRVITNPYCHFRIFFGLCWFIIRSVIVAAPAAFNRNFMKFSTFAEFSSCGEPLFAKYVLTFGYHHGICKWRARSCLSVGFFLEIPKKQNYLFFAYNCDVVIWLGFWLFAEFRGLEVPKDVHRCAVDEELLWAMFSPGPWLQLNLADVLVALDLVALLNRDGETMHEEILAPCNCNWAALMRDLCSVCGHDNSLAWSCRGDRIVGGIAAWWETGRNGNWVLHLPTQMNNNDKILLFQRDKMGDQDG